MLGLFPPQLGVPTTEDAAQMSLGRVTNGYLSARSDHRRRKIDRTPRERLIADRHVSYNYNIIVSYNYSDRPCVAEGNTAGAV